MSDQPDPGLLELAKIDKDAVFAEQIIQHYRTDFEKSLAYELVTGPVVAFDSFLAAVKTDVANTPKLAAACRASPGTLISALHFAAQCKLLPGSRYGLLYLIPRNMSRQRGGRWEKVPEVTAMLGYKGIALMMQRSPRVHSVEAHCVYEGEEFDYQPGEGTLHHRYDWRVDRSDEKLLLAYAKVTITELNATRPVDKPIVWPMTRAQILAIRDKAESYKNAEKSWNGKPPERDSPWHVYFASMARKSTIRAVGSNGSVQLDMGVGGMLARDEEMERGETEVKIAPPAATTQSAIRVSLGLDAPPPMFEFAEEALAAIEAAPDVVACERLVPGFAHLQGSDAEAVSVAYQDRLAVLRGS